MAIDQYHFWTKWSETDGEWVDLCETEDVEDHRELVAARAENDYAPWDEVKAALDLK